MSKTETTPRVAIDGQTTVDSLQQQGLTRRRVFAGAGAAGALAAAAVVLPLAQRAAPAAAAGEKLAEAGGDGYQVTDHVLRYYQSARV